MLFTSALFVDASLVVGTRRVAATAADAQAVFAYLVGTALGVRIAHRLTDPVVTPFVGQTSQVSAKDDFAVI